MIVLLFIQMVAVPLPRFRDATIAPRVRAANSSADGGGSPENARRSDGWGIRRSHSLPAFAHEEGKSIIGDGRRLA